MFELSVQTVFSAAHALLIAGAREPVHGHDWHVTLTLVGQHLDADGLLVDFHEIEQMLRQIVAPFANADLNNTPPFDRINPSAERVAQHIAESMVDRLDGRDVRVASVRVTEAPGCAVVFRPEEGKALAGKTREGSVS